MFPELNMRNTISRLVASNGIKPDRFTFNSLRRAPGFPLSCSAEGDCTTIETWLT
jgi:hypothetical protein